MRRVSWALAGLALVSIIVVAIATTDNTDPTATSTLMAEVASNAAAESLPLDSEDARARAPDVASFLDRAIRHGSAKETDQATIAEIMSYLDGVARDNGANGLFSRPHQGMVEWESETIRIVRIAG